MLTIYFQFIIKSCIIKCDVNQHVWLIKEKKRAKQLTHFNYEHSNLLMNSFRWKEDIFINRISVKVDVEREYFPCFFFLLILIFILVLFFVKRRTVICSIQGLYFFTLWLFKVCARISHTHTYTHSHTHRYTYI